jgi:hypothetical protein
VLKEWVTWFSAVTFGAWMQPVLDNPEGGNLGKTTLTSVFLLGVSCQGALSAQAQWEGKAKEPVPCRLMAH